MFEDHLWSHKQTADYLGITEQALYWLNHKGTGPARHRIGRSCHYRRSDIDAWLHSRRIPAATSH